MFRWFDLRIEDERTTFDQFVARLSRMYAEGSTAPIDPLVTSGLRRRYAYELEVLERFGLIKSVTYAPHQAYQALERSQIRAQADGKLDRGLNLTFAARTETYRDRQGREVCTLTYPRTENRMISVRSRVPELRDGPTEIACHGCGAPIAVDGDAAECPYCHARYRTEILTWRVAAFIDDADDRLFRFSDLQQGLLRLGMLCLGLSGTTLLAGLFLASVVPSALSPDVVDTAAWLLGRVAAVGGVALLLGIVTPLVFLCALLLKPFTAIPRALRFRRLRRRDPNSSRDGLARVAERMLQAHPELLRRHADRTGALVVDAVHRVDLIRYRRDPDRERITVAVRVSGKRIGPDRRGVLRVRPVVRRIRLRLERGAQVRTPVHYQPERYTCPNCGSPQAVRDGRIQTCAYCGHETPLAELDWALADSA